MSLIIEHITSTWQAVIGRAREKKYEVFGRQADDAYHFFASADHSCLYDQAYMTESLGLSAADIGESIRFKATVNLTGNAVNVFLPVLQNRSPIRTVAPKQVSFDDQLISQALIQVGVRPMDPAVRQRDLLLKNARAALFGHYLNSTTKELNFKADSRLAVLEAFVKGMGVMWSATFPATDGTFLTGSEFDSVDYLLIDPDAEQWKHAGFIVRKRCEPIYQIERKFGLEPGTLTDYADTHGASTAPREDSDGDPLNDYDESITCDSMVYYEVYSRIGMGSNLKDGTIDEHFDEYSAESLDAFGDEVYLAIPSVLSGYRHPLNLPEELFDELDDEELDDEAAAELLDELKKRIAWPIPAFHDRSNPWPCCPLVFHPMPKSPWGKSHMADSMGIQKAIDWILSFLIGRMHLTSRALMAVPRDLSEEIQDQILYGKDLELLRIDAAHPGTLEQLVAFIKMPEVNGEIWNLLMELKRQFEDSTGVTELNMSARNSVQMRSAEEARMKQNILSVRPDDMKQTVEEWHAAVARLEAGAAAATMQGDDIARVFCEPRPSEVARVQSLAASQMGFAAAADGPTEGPYTALWMKLIHDMPVDQMFSELEFSIESGSGQKPDNDAAMSNVDETGKLFVNFMWQTYQATGDPSQLNAWIAEYAKSRGITKYQWLMFPDMRQQMQQQQAAAAMAAAGGGGAGPGQGQMPPGGPPTGGPPQGGPPQLPMPAGMPGMGGGGMPAMLEQLLSGLGGGMPMDPSVMDPNLAGAV